MLAVTIDDKRARRAMDRTVDGLSQTHRMLDVVARGFRDHVRKTIATQDGGSWERPSKWTRAKKRQMRALPGQSINIKHIFAGRKQALVVYQGQSKETGQPISITEHHYGKALPPTGKLVRIPIRAPSALGLTRGITEMWFRSRRPSVVPARKIWPDRPGEAQRIAEPLASNWVRVLTNRTWK